MRVAIVGSRSLTVQNLEAYLPQGVTEIISGGARGVDTCARQYALRHHLKLTEFLPDYARYGRAAPLKRNITIIENADLVLAFWDGNPAAPSLSCVSAGSGVFPYSCFWSPKDPLSHKIILYKRKHGGPFWGLPCFSSFILRFSFPAAIYR